MFGMLCNVFAIIDSNIDLEFYTDIETCNSTRNFVFRLLDFYRKQFNVIASAIKQESLATQLGFLLKRYRLTNVGGRMNLLF